MDLVLDNPLPLLAYDPDQQVLDCRGDWTFYCVHEIKKLFSSLSAVHEDVKTINVSAIAALDTAGILLLMEIQQQCAHVDITQQAVGLRSEWKDLFDFISQEEHACESKQQPVPRRSNIFDRTGQQVVRACFSIVAFFAFLGELITVLLLNVRKPILFAWSAMFSCIEDVGLKALPIIGLMTFLIGLVLAYQLSGELREYGADVFVVEITGIAILREFGPLITAIVMAGRTSTSFAALIGTMKVNEELDALNTMGVTPMSQLVLPRIIAVFIIMPLLIVWADIFGVIGSMFMSRALMGITLTGFLARFHMEVSATEFLLGMVKAPAFALIIAGVGSVQGLAVGHSADSVGKQTTKAAVQAIFLVIIFDALFSIVFSILGV